MSYENVPRWLREIPEHFKTQEMCSEMVAQFSYALMYFPDHLRQEMCNQAVRNNPATFFLVPDHFKTQDMCIKVLAVDPWQLKDVPDYFKTQKMCEELPLLFAVCP